jgi:hypothetical protein
MLSVDCRYPLLWITSLYNSNRFCYLRLDSLPARRIIKDVMIRQLGDEEEVKNWREKVAKRRITGPGENDPDVTDVFEDIDPADFFDPEEFGLRPRRAKSRP